MSRYGTDYSEYNLSDGEKYHARHRSAENIEFEFLRNEVLEKKEARALLIDVDDFFENENITPIYAKIEGYDDLGEYEKRVLQSLIDADPKHLQNQKVTSDQNVEIFKKAQESFEIVSDFYNDPNEVNPLINPFSGAQVTVPLGEGILNFSYADFDSAFERSKTFYAFMSTEFWDEQRRQSDMELSDPKPMMVRNKDEEIIHYYQQYSETMLMLSHVLYASIYTSIFPPVVTKPDFKAFGRYYAYLKNLQKEMLELIEFCFDEDFYRNVFSGLYPSERYRIFCEINSRSPLSERRELFNVNINRMSGDTMPFGMPISDVVARLGSNLPELTDEHRAFMKRFSIEEDRLRAYLKLPAFINTVYECRSVYGILNLEFTKMLEQELRFKKCKNCGRYFILKGKYRTEYCDRVPDGETQNCQMLASLRNYREKISSNAAWGLYNKYYKRYHARMKAGTIKEPIFKQWQYKATAMRDDCAAGTVSAEDFEAWLHGSFKNRAKK